jgi:hypothetical protein
VSSTLAIEIDAGPIERVRADVAVVAFFESDRPLRGGAGRVDWRLCGQLSQLILSGRLAGAPGEAVLIPTHGGLAAALLLGLGIGARNEFDAEACEALGWHCVDRARRLGAGTVAVSLPDSQAGDLELGERIEALVSGAVRALADVSAELRLSLVPPVPELAAAQKLVKDIALRQLPTAVRLRLAGQQRLHPTAIPPGARGSSATSPQTIK